MLRYWMLSCNSAHTSCCAAGCCLALPHSLALPQIRHATLLDVLLHFHTYVMLRCWICSCTSTWWVCESPLLRVLPWPEHRLWTDSGIGYKTRFPGSCIHTKAADKTSQKFGSPCMLQSGARASKAMSWTTSANFVLEAKTGTFRRNPRRTKLQFRACKTLDFPLLRSPFQGVCIRNLFQKNNNVQITTVSDISIIVLGPCVISSPTRPLTNVVAKLYVYP